MSKRRLGKGIDALLQGRDLTQLENLEQESVSVIQVPIDRIAANPNQPRKTFTEESLQELARSIEERGILQPILAEETSDGEYRIIAGERRFRAARLAGLTVVPVLSGEFSEEEKLEIALIENIQRENINPIEEATAYRELMETASLTQEELAHRLGKSRPAVANTLRLLKLSEPIQVAVSGGTISAGHARALLGIDNDTLATEAFHRVVADALSVRQTEELCNATRSLGRLPQPEERLQSAAPETGADFTDVDSSSGASRNADARKNAGSSKTVEMAEIEQRLIERLGTRVVLSGSNSRGKIEIAYLSMDDLERIIDIIGE